MITIAFNGWFEARFATDDDDFDHPRGSNLGWTFATDGEPDFDRIIRFHNPVAPRSHGPTVGVFVRSVEKNSQIIASHPLVGAPVELLDGPKFEGHNGDIAGDGREPVFPLHMRIASGPLVVETTEWLAFADLEFVIPRHGKGVRSVDPTLLKSLLGGLDPTGFRTRRKALLTTDLATATGTARTALQQRIAQINPANPNDLRNRSLGMRVPYQTAIPAANRIIADPNDDLGPGDPLKLQWSCEWWMGVWDADALCGFVEGKLIMK